MASLREYTPPLSRAFVLLILAANASASTPSWSGEYIYDSSYGRSYGGSPIQAHYMILISEERNICRIVISGYQTEEKIICAARKSGNAIRLLFKSYSSGETTNVYGVAIYKPGKTLLTLEQRIEDGDASLITHWMEIKGLDNKRPASGIYFKKKQVGKGGIHDTSRDVPATNEK